MLFSMNDPMTGRRDKINSAVLMQVTLILFMVAFSSETFPVSSADLLQRELHLSPILKTRVPIASVQVKNTYPHDGDAFTQGLIFHQGYFYESTGLTGKSTLARKDVKTGRSVQEISLPADYFGEGIALLGEKIYQLTWRNQMLLIYDSRSFRETGKIKYPGEGWGLTSDGKHLLMSNGSSVITFHDPDSFKVLKKIHVRDGDMPVNQLNELEFVKGEIWANIYREDIIARISPLSGKVLGWIDLTTLRSYLPQNAAVDVLNGIAYDERQERIFVTGKYWPRVFEIQLSK